MNSFVSSGTTSNRSPLLLPGVGRQFGNMILAAVGASTLPDGEMAFVTVRHELGADGSRVGAEEQDIVYRSEPPGTQPRVVSRPESGEPGLTGDWRLEIEGVRLAELEYDLVDPESFDQFFMVGIVPKRSRWSSAVTNVRSMT